MSWFKQGPSPYQTALAMVGAKPGGIVVVLGAGNGGLAAELARITGLNGRTLVVDPAPGAQAIIAAAAARAGALVDVESAPLADLPVESGTTDIAVVNGGLGAAGTARRAIIEEAVRVIRPGGRVVVIEGTPPRGFFAQRLDPSTSVGLPGADILELFGGTGLPAVRILFESEGISYVEAVKPRPKV